MGNFGRGQFATDISLEFFVLFSDSLTISSNQYRSGHDEHRADGKQSLRVVLVPNGCVRLRLVPVRLFPVGVRRYQPAGQQKQAHEQEDDANVQRCDTTYHFLVTRCVGTEAVQARRAPFSAIRSDQMIRLVAGTTSFSSHGLIPPSTLAAYGDG